MKNTIAILIMISCWSCDIINPGEKVPSFIQIDTVLFTESNETHNIKDVWVSVEGDVVGAFEIPATIPVFVENGNEIQIKAGIMKDGMPEGRIAYPFYTIYTENPSFNEGEVTEITPIFSYFDFEAFWQEDFEESGHIIDTTYRSDVNVLFNTIEAKYGERCGAIILEGENEIFEGVFAGEFDLPKNNSPVFIELDYKNNIEFEIRIIAFNPRDIDQERVLIIYPYAYWNKLYIDLTSLLKEFQNAIDFTFVIQAVKTDEVEKGEIYLDNIKVIKFL